MALLPYPRLVDVDPLSTVRPTGTARFVHDRSLPVEGYRISISSEGDTVVEASADPGSFYASQTLAQLRRIFGDDRLPVGVIEDWPDLPVRGVMLDVSRTKVPTLDTLFGIVDRLASWKLNHLQLYMEHTYAYSHHEEVWEQADPYDSADLGRLSSFCAQRHIELVPNQNTLGHMERWLVHDRYAQLGIKRGVVKSPFGMEMAASTLDPAKPESLLLVRELISELGGAVPGRRFHLGLDEPWELPPERSHEWGNWLHALRSLPELAAREVLVWGDVLAVHRGLVRGLDEGVTVCEWGYESDHPFTARSEHLAEAGIDHWLCPGTSSWMSVLGRTSNAIENCRSAAKAALDTGAGGLMVTDWGDFGHHQYLPVSDPGLAAAAAFAWCCESNDHLDTNEVARVLDVHSYEELGRQGEGIGRALALLGDAYSIAPVQMPNMSALVAHMYLPQLEVGGGLTAGLESSHLDQVESVLAEASRSVGEAQPGNLHGRLAVSELMGAIHLVGVLCRDARARLAVGGSLSRVDRPTRAGLAVEIGDVVEEHRSLWLGRNRPGGLEESCRWLDHLRDCYLSGAPDPRWAGPFVESIRAPSAGSSETAGDWGQSG